MKNAGRAVILRAEMSKYNEVKLRQLHVNGAGDTLVVTTDSRQFIEVVSLRFLYDIQTLKTVFVQSDLVQVTVER